MKRISALYLLTSLAGLWFLTKSWLPPGFALVGHDSGLALDAREFLLTRFYAWDQQGFGMDNSMHFGSIVLHSIDYLLSTIAGVPYAGNQVAVFFWLGLVFMAGFVFAYQLKERLGNLFTFFFPVFVTFNFFIFQSIFVLERAKYSIFISLLLFLAISIKLLENKQSLTSYKLSVLPAAILASFVFFIFNSGSWLGLPLYGSVGVAAGTLILFTFLECLKSKNFSKVRRLLAFLALTIIGFLLLESYAIWPYFVSFTTRDYLSLVDKGVVAANKAWLDSVSEATSFLNIFRLQGIPDWYAGASSPSLAHSYAKDYLTNPLLIIASFAFPILAFFSLFLSRGREQKRIIVLFALLTLIAMFFMAGTHPPLGLFYEALYSFVPGFAIFRSPYFKFGSAFVLGMSLLMAFSLTSLISSVLRRVRAIPQIFVSIVLSAVSLILWFAFHYVIFDAGKILYWQTGQTTKVSVPQYIYDFKNWSLKENRDNKRILLLPPLNPDWQNDGYEWGYWSLSTLPSVLTPKSVVTNDRLLLNEEREWINMLYRKIQDRSEEGMLGFAKKLGVGYFLIREDVLHDASWSATHSPLIYKPILEGFSSVKKVKTFDKWIVYKIDEDKLTPKIFPLDALVAVPVNHQYIGREFLRDEYMYLLKEKENPADLAKFHSKAVDVSTCQSCVLERQDALTSLPAARILPNSALYYFKILREIATLKEATTSESKADAYLGFTLIRTGEVKTMLDSGIDESYVVKNLQIMNLYLKNFYELLQTFSNPISDYNRARHLLDVINVIEKYLREYVTSSEFGKQGESFRQEMLGALWQIYTIKNYYLPLYGDRDILAKEKVYFARFPELGNYKLFLHTNSLPTGPDGKPVLPSLVEYEKGDQKLVLEVVTEQDGWVEIKLPGQEAGQAQIKLKLEEPPNLFQLVGSELRQSPTGTRACYYGKIDLSQKNKKYNIRVRVSKKDQALRMFFQESDKTRDPNGFIRGEGEIDILPILSYEPFRYLYYPSGYAKESTVYLCSGNKELPVFDEIGIYEISAPLLLTTRDLEVVRRELPQVSFNQINSTKYSIKVEDARDPFVLAFNERYSPFWKLSTNSSNKNLVATLLSALEGRKDTDPEHFPLDGYANGWIVNGEGDFDLTIEYSLQNYFYAGSIGTAVAILGLSTLLLYPLLRRRHD